MDTAERERTIETTDADKCCICLGILVTPGLARQTSACGHVFHEQCIFDMRRIPRCIEHLLYQSWLEEWARKTIQL